MTRKAPVFPLLLLALALAPTWGADAPRLESIVPADSTFFLIVEDAPGFLESWPTSPLGKTWNDPQVKKFFRPMREQMDFDRWEEITQEKTGFPLSKILESFTGQAALVIHTIDLNDAGDEDDEISFAVIAEAEDGAEVIKGLMALDLEHTKEQEDEAIHGVLQEVEEEFRGETLHIRTRITEESTEESEGWAIVDGFAVVAEPKSLLQEFVANVKDGGSDKSLSGNAGFQKIRRHSNGADLLAYLNLEALVPMLQEAAAAGTEGAEPNPLGITPQAILDALSLDVLQGLYVATRMGKSETIVDAGLLYTGEKGLVKVLAYGPGPVELPNFLPDGIASAGVTNFSVPEAWVALREILAGLNPAIPGMLDMYLQQFATNAGFDLEKSIFGSLGDTMVSAQFYPEPDEPGEQPSYLEVESLFGLEVTDRQTLEMALEGLKNMLAPGMELFDEREYLGHTIYVTKQSFPTGAEGVEQSVAYVLTEDYFFLSMGSARPLEAVLSQAAKPARSIWKRKDLKAAMAKLPKDASSLMYYDVSSLIGSMFQSMATVQRLTTQAVEEGQAEGEEPEEPFCDPDELPDQSIFDAYFGIGVGAIQKRADGLFVTVRLLEP